jgi:hypothetical protein
MYSVQLHDLQGACGGLVADVRIGGCIEVVPGRILRFDWLEELSCPNSGGASADPANHNAGSAVFVPGVKTDQSDASNP